MSKENTVQTTSGWPMLPMPFLLVLGGLALTIWLGTQIEAAERAREPIAGWVALTILSGLAIPAGIITVFGFFALQPNQARVLVLFGHYRGTVRDSGFHWTNPFMSKLKISLRRATWKARSSRSTTSAATP